MTEAQQTELLFSYGTLQQESVQLSTFGRLGGEHAMIGYRLDMVEITDPEVLQRQRPEIPSHRVAHRHSADEVAGQVCITPAELAAADDYEVSDYKRVLAPLKSGKPGCTCARNSALLASRLVPGWSRTGSIAEQRRHQLSIRSHRHPRSHQGRARHVRPG